MGVMKRRKLGGGEGIKGRLRMCKGRDSWHEGQGGIRSEIQSLLYEVIIAACTYVKV